MSTSAERAKSIFLNALEIDSPQRRQAYVDSECGNDDGLRLEIEELLQHEAQAGDFLEDRPTLAGHCVTECPGTVIGPYKLLEQIGEGGFGIVFMADQTQPIRRKVALKVVKPGMDTRQVIARFEAERQALAIMDHPNIAGILDGGETTTGRPYFVMELVRGVYIVDFCDQNHLSVRERLNLFVTICHAVQHAHQKGIIHRDLKPSNILVTMHDAIPVVKVIDFGIAKAMGQQLTEKTLFTNFAQMVGTPLYMSPEQAQMSGIDVDTRSDIYSLGVLLYELLTGTTPFDQQRMRTVAYDEMRRIIREEDPPKPSTRMSTLGQGASTVSANRQSNPVQLRQMLRGDLDWIVMKCLEKDRNRRYETANALAMDLQRFLQDEPVLASPPSTVYRLGKFARRNKVALVTTGLFTGVLILSSVMSIWQAIRATQAGRLAESRLKEADTARTVAVTERNRAVQRLFEARLAQARASRLSKRIGQRFEGWKAVTEAAQLARDLGLENQRLIELREEAIACLALADVRMIDSEWEGLPIGWKTPAFDADLKHYARSDAKGNISIRRLSDDRQLQLLPGQGPGDRQSGAAMIAFSPDAKHMAVRNWHQLPGRTTNFQLWDWKSSLCVFQPKFNVCGDALAFSPDGLHLALGSEHGLLTIHQVPTGELVNSISLGSKPQAVAFHPDGSQLAIASHANSEVQIRDVATGKLLRKWNTPAGIYGIAWHPDGLLLATGCGDNRAYLWDSTTGSQHRVLQGHQNSVIKVAFAPRSEILLSESWDESSRIWDIATGRELLRLGRSELSRDGRRLILRAGAKFTPLEVTDGQEYRTLPRRGFNQTEGLSRGGFSPDGRWLAAGTSAGVRLWDLARPKESALLAMPAMVDAKFHPAGTELFTAGRTGLFSWPLETQPAGLKIGPPRKLDLNGALEAISLDRNGGLVSAVGGGHNGGVQILSLEKSGNHSIRSLRHGNAVSVAMSPDGDWVATGIHEGFGIKVWNAKNGQLLRDLIPDENITSVAASPDGRWLVTGCKAAFDIWQARNWERVHHIVREPDAAGGCGATFSPDGKVLAIPLSLSIVQLLEPQSGRSLARLQPPDADAIEWLAFSHDGSQLAVCTGARVIRIWDLRFIREELKEIGLDWDLPPYPPSPLVDGAQPIQIEVELGELSEQKRKN